MFSWYQHLHSRCLLTGSGPAFLSLFLLSKCFFGDDVLVRAWVQKAVFTSLVGVVTQGKGFLQSRVCLRAENFWNGWRMASPVKKLWRSVPSSANMMPHVSRKFPFPRFSWARVGCVWPHKCKRLCHFRLKMLLLQFNWWTCGGW